MRKRAPRQRPPRGHRAALRLTCIIFLSARIPTTRPPARSLARSLLHPSLSVPVPPSQMPSRARTNYAETDKQHARERVNERRSGGRKESREGRGRGGRERERETRLTARPRSTRLAGRLLSSSFRHRTRSRAVSMRFASQFAIAPRVHARSGPRAGEGGEKEREGERNARDTNGRRDGKRCKA